MNVETHWSMNMDSSPEFLSLLSSPQEKPTQQKSYDSSGCFCSQKITFRMMEAMFGGEYVMMGDDCAQTDQQSCIVSLHQFINSCNPLPRINVELFSTLTIHFPWLKYWTLDGDLQISNRSYLVSIFDSFFHRLLYFFTDAELDPAYPATHQTRYPIWIHYSLNPFWNRIR